MGFWIPTFDCQNAACKHLATFPSIWRHEITGEASLIPENNVFFSISRKRESRRAYLTTRLKVQFYYVPVMEEQPSSCSMEVCTMLILLGALLRWDVTSLQRVIKLWWGQGIHFLPQFCAMWISCHVSPVPGMCSAWPDRALWVGCLSWKSWPMVREQYQHPVSHDSEAGHHGRRGALPSDCIP